MLAKTWPRFRGKTASRSWESFGSWSPSCDDAELAEQLVPEFDECGVVPVPGPVRGTSTGTLNVMRPSARTSTRSASTSASSTSWVTSSTAGRCRCHRRSTRPCMAIRVSASSALNGSSSSSRPGSRTSARASDARWASPPDRVSGQAWLVRSGPPRPGRSRAAASGSRSRRPRATLASTLRQGSSRGSWNATATVVGPLITPVTSRSSPASARSSVDLPVPLTPEQGDELAGRDVQVQAVEHRAGRRRRGLRSAVATAAGSRRGSLRPRGGVRGAMPAPSSPAAGPGRR